MVRLVGKWLLGQHSQECSVRFFPAGFAFETFLAGGGGVRFPGCRVRLRRSRSTPGYVLGPPSGSFRIALLSVFWVLVDLVDLVDEADVAD